MSKLSVAEAAKRMKISTQCLRVNLQLQRMPVGTAVKLHPNNKRWKYEVFEDRVDKYVKGELT